MATLAQEAYSLLADYGALGRLNDAMWMAEPSAEPEVFRQWARSFQQECTRHRCLPRCELMEAVYLCSGLGRTVAASGDRMAGIRSRYSGRRSIEDGARSARRKAKALSWEIEQLAAADLYAAPSERDESAAVRAWVRSRLAC